MKGMRKISSSQPSSTSQGGFPVKISHRMATLDTGMDTDLQYVPYGFTDRYLEFLRKDSEESVRRLLNAMKRLELERLESSFHDTSSIVMELVSGDNSLLLDYEVQFLNSIIFTGIYRNVGPEVANELTVTILADIINHELKRERKYDRKYDEPTLKDVVRYFLNNSKEIDDDGRELVHLLKTIYGDPISSDDMFDGDLGVKFSNTHSRIVRPGVFVDPGRLEVELKFSSSKKEDLPVSPIELVNMSREIHNEVIDSLLNPPITSTLPEDVDNIDEVLLDDLEGVDDLLHEIERSYSHVPGYLDESRSSVNRRSKT